MVQALPKNITFAKFLDWKPEGERYELRDGEIIEMQPDEIHEKITGFLATELAAEFGRLNLPYFMPQQALVKVPSRETGYSPDVLILNRPALTAEPLWEKSSTVTQGASIPLVIEVISIKWRVDYLDKVRDYEAINIPEYWIVDYLSLGGRRYIGNSIEPTICVYFLVDGEYEVNHFKGSDLIKSPTFPDLNLTAQQVFQAGGSSKLV
ncbi:Uma2 family endonuclease [Cylindrospermum sp. FACHB-282]|uniref:Uma2 family endonuclease n=1 Tax=Cylindrospermum sp. FACHB-282 TaxID=2692794 RepID=UPI001686185E|nr:Uma2 family endonuclease [Cylindrospermum sp. FACHB-282]MBD2386155.1 Uma2 family endonuclease [Cylindrospermum sp. FACHB-282]